MGDKMAGLASRAGATDAVLCFTQPRSLWYNSRHTKGG